MGDFEPIVTAASSDFVTIVEAVLSICALIFGINMAIVGVRYLIAAIGIRLIIAGLFG